MRLALRILAMTALAALAVALGACGSDDDDSSGSASTSASTTAKSDPGLSAETQKALDAAYKGTFGEPPSTAPKPQPGKNIWVIQLAAGVTDMARSGQILDAAKVMGWKVNLFDGKYDPGTWVSGIRQAIAAKADGIILFAVDCAPVKSALAEATKAGIPTVGWEAIDCDKTVSKTGEVKDTGQPGLFSAAITYAGADGEQETLVEALGTQMGEIQGLGVTAATKGKAKVIQLNATDCPICSVAVRGFQESLKKHCPDCEIVDTVDFVGPEAGPKLQDKVSQALTQHPDANAFDSVSGYMSPPPAAAVVASGRKDEIYGMGGEGTAEEANLIRDDKGLNAGVGFSVDWEAWAALDAMNRLFSGEKPEGRGFPSGLGFQLFDKDHALPPKDKNYQPPVDYVSAYTKAWGG